MDLLMRLLFVGLFFGIATISLGVMSEPQIPWFTYPFFTFVGLGSIFCSWKVFIDDL